MEPDIVRPRTLKKQKLQRNPQPERLRMPDELLVRSTIAISFKNSSSVSFRQRAGSPSTSVHLCLPLPFVRLFARGAGVELGRPKAPRWSQVGPCLRPLEAGPI